MASVLCQTLLFFVGLYYFLSDFIIFLQENEN
jgi:hypothetical protein